MRPRITALAAFALLFAPDARGELIGPTSPWLVTSQVRKDEFFPEFSEGSVEFDYPRDGFINIKARAYAENPPGPGGPSTRVTATWDSGFEVVTSGPDAKEWIRFEVDYTRTIAVSPNPPGGSAQVTYEGFMMLGTSLGDPVLLYVSLDNSSDRQTFDVLLGAGFYFLSGSLSIGAFLPSGGDELSIAYNITTGVKSIPAIPAPAGSTLTLLGLAGLAAGACRGWQTKRDRRPGTCL